MDEGLDKRLAELRAKLFDLGKVLEERVEENGDLLLEVELAQRDLEQLQKNEDVLITNGCD